MAKLDLYKDENGIIPFINEIGEDISTESISSNSDSDSDEDEEEKYPKAQFRLEGAFFISDSIEEKVYVYLYAPLSFISLDSLTTILRGIDLNYRIQLVFTSWSVRPYDFLEVGSLLNFIEGNERVSVHVPYMGDVLNFLMFAASENRVIDNFVYFDLYFNPDHWGAPFDVYKDSVIDYLLRRGMIDDTEAGDLKKGKTLYIPNSRVKTYGKQE